MDVGLSEDTFQTKTIDDLPDEVLEYILSLISPYKDSESCKLVSKRWYKTIRSVSRQLTLGLYRSLSHSNVLWHTLVLPDSATISQRYSHAACYCDNYMYVFGGCTSRCTTFNDLWSLDLNNRTWVRLCTTGSYPSPKACATFVCYNKNLILFGGWTHPPSYPIHQSLKLFNELHVYNITSNKWTVIHSTHSPPPSAGHSVTIHGNLMVMFGGLQRDETVCLNRSSNDIWCYNLDTETWYLQEATEPKPKSRYGQSQIYIDEDNFLIMGGCIAPNFILDDIWLLTMTDPVWTWKQIKVNNSHWAAPQLWCHPSCKVGNSVVVFSRGPSAALSHYSLCSSAETESSLADASIPPEVAARVASQGHLPYVKDTNVNGQRGSLVKPSRSSNEPEASSSADEGPPPVANRNVGPKCNVVPNHRDPEPRCSGHNCSLNDVMIMAAFRHQATCPKAIVNSRNRVRQLEGLKRMEEKYKNPLKRETRRKQAKEKSEASEDCPENRMNMYVMDITDVLTDTCVSWRPPRSNSGASQEKILHSLVLGKNELILFGGLLRKATCPGINYVSNSTYIIKAPRNII